MKTTFFTERNFISLYSYCVCKPFITVPPSGVQKKRKAKKKKKSAQLCARSISNIMHMCYWSLRQPSLKNKIKFKLNTKPMTHLGCPNIKDCPSACNRQILTLKMKEGLCPPMSQSVFLPNQGQYMADRGSIMK